MKKEYYVYPCTPLFRSFSVLFPTKKKLIFLFIVLEFISLTNQSVMGALGNEMNLIIMDCNLLKLNLWFTCKEKKIHKKIKNSQAIAMTC